MVQEHRETHARPPARWTLLVATLAFAAFAFTSAGRAQAAPSLEREATSAAEASVVSRYWTPRRMRRADSAGMPRLGVPGDADPVPRLAGGVDGFAVPVTNPDARPQRFHGRLFFTHTAPDGSRQDASCSGTVIRAPNRSTMLTAGHCIYDGTWSDDVLFVPAYRNGQAPFGEYPASAIGTTGQWKRFVSSSIDLAYSYDVGAAVLGRDPATGRRVQDALGGGRGVAFDLRRPARDFSVYGYPATGAFDGETPLRCRSRLLWRDSSGFRPRPGAVRCDMRQGASGGGWVVKVGGVGRVASVTSYNLRDDAAHLYGPYFGNAVRRLFEAVRRR